MLNIGRKIKRKKAQLDELGMFIRLLQIDYVIKSKEHLAKLITEHFNKVCDVADIEKYEQMHIAQEDYEKLSRMVSNGNLEHLVEDYEQMYLDVIEKQQLYINDFLPKE